MDSGGSATTLIAAVAGIVLLAAVGMVLFVLRRGGSPPSPAVRAAPPSTPAHAAEARRRPPVGTARVPTEAAPTEDRPTPSAPARRSSGPAGEPTPAPRPETVAHEVRTAILQRIAEVCPAGWHALILSPPAHPRQMTWHVHFRAEVSLDLADGRTVPTTPPSGTDEWVLPSGRAVRVALGDPTPGPTEETSVIRVTGSYLSTTYLARGSGAFLVRVGGEPSTQHEYRAGGARVSQLASILGEALQRAIADRTEDAKAMGYSPSSWAAHERTWIAERERPR